jgi:tetratricopeptide (TPR) repeat protein
VDLTRAVETGCLQCHASRLQPVAGTQNRFASPPFLEGGVSCERCHGPGAEHVKARRAGRSHQKDIVNPAKLSPDTRDSVCAQCHLTGAARVARKAKTAYRPGDLLSSSLAVFVWSEGSSELSATSHYEQLQQSACKRASGDQFWCGTCHTPHAAAEASQYRERCLLCHGTKGCTETVAARSANGNDCTACHMPKRDSRAVEHIAFTDHGIVRRKPAPVAPLGERRLISFWRNVDDRDLALGYAVVAAGEPAVRRQALQLLEAAAARDSADVAVLAQLAQFYDRLGREDQAMGLCERILALDPSHIAAAVNLGIYRVKRGASDEAIRLWKAALQRNPALTGARVNLAVAQFRSGQAAEAEASLRTALEYDPDSDTARRMLAEIQGASK